MFNIDGGVKKGLLGYMYVRCSKCGAINRAAYGKPCHMDGHGAGTPCVSVFVINEKAWWLLYAMFVTQAKQRHIF